MYLVTDYCSGKDLSFLIASKICLDEKDACFYTAEIIIALNYLHNKGIFYRDLKPENVLLDLYGNLKIADFGLSKSLEADERAYSFCGSSE